MSVIIERHHGARILFQVIQRGEVLRELPSFASAVGWAASNLRLSPAETAQFYKRTQFSNGTTARGFVPERKLGIRQREIRHA